MSHVTNRGTEEQVKNPACNKYDWLVRSMGFGFGISSVFNVFGPGTPGPHLTGTGKPLTYQGERWCKGFWSQSHFRIWMHFEDPLPVTSKSWATKTNHLFAQPCSGYGRGSSFHFSSLMILENPQPSELAVAIGLSRPQRARNVCQSAKSTPCI